MELYKTLLGEGKSGRLSSLVASVWRQNASQRSYTPLTTVDCEQRRVLTAELATRA